jgi:hypothetical protein
MEKWILKVSGIPPIVGEIMKNVLQCPEIWACWLPLGFGIELGY